MSFQGDSIVNGVQYKKCIEEDCYGQQTVVALVREKDQVVYSIGGSTANILPGEYVGEIILYDFNNPIRMFPEDVFYEFEQSTIDIEGISHNCYTCDYGNNKIIEGIGIDGSGSLINLEFAIYTSTHYQYTGLSYVEDNGSIIYKGSAYEEPTHYQPLVREGVVWHYAYHHFSYDSYYGHSTIQRLQFKGDTIINDVYYKKCYFYGSEILDENEKPLCCAREENGKVMFTAYRHEITDTLCELFPYFGIPGEHYEGNGEVMMFDFSDMQGFVDNINDQGDVYAQIQSTSDVIVNGLPAKSYKIEASGCYPCSFIEGVGSDGMNTGYLFAPFVMLSISFGPWPLGLVKITDLDGNTLYKGACFDVLPSGDMNDDGRVDISDVNEVINAMLGKSTASADVTGDGVVDIADVNAVINAMLGK